jgi:twitching motility protein PilU
LINSPLISDYIRKGEIHEIKDLMKRSRELGMQTFDQAYLIYIKQVKLPIKMHLNMPTHQTIYV